MKKILDEFTAKDFIQFFGIVLTVVIYHFTSIREIEGRMIKNEIKIDNYEKRFDIFASDIRSDLREMKNDLKEIRKK